MLDPYSDYAEVNISLNNSSSLSFFIVYAPPIRSSPKDSRTNFFFPPFFLPPQISLFWETSIVITPSKTQKVLPTPVGRKHSIGSSPLTFSPSMSLTYLLFFILPTLISPLLLSLSPYLAPGRCFRTWVLKHLPIPLAVRLSPVFRPNERLPSLNFRKACWDDFAFYFNSYCPSAKEYSSLFLFFAAVLFTFLTLNALLTIWCSGQTALFLSLLAKTALAYLPTALSVH